MNRRMWKCSRRLRLAHLPNGLATKLADAEKALYVVAERDELAERARIVEEAAGWFPNRRDDFAVALGVEPESTGQLPDWLMTLVLDLGRSGLGAEATRVGEALAQVDPELRGMLDGDVAVALAEAGLAEQARARIESNLTRWPADIWIRLHAGDALAALGDLDGAAAHFDAAVSMAEVVDDFEARSDAIERLRHLGQQRPSAMERRQAPTSRSRRQPTRPSRSQRKRRR